MKPILTALLAITLLCAPFTSASAGTKMDKRHAYVLQNLKLDKKTEAAFSPILMGYLKAKKEANKAYDDLKDKYKSMEKAGTLTDGQATQLLDAKLACAAKELEVKKQYYEEFKKILKPKKIWYAFDLANDKMSKIDGKD